MTKNESGASARSPFSLPIMVLLLLSSVVLSSFNLGRSQVHAAAPITPSGLNTQVTLSATPPAGKTQYDITGGTRPGGATGTNLFHSFGDFNVPTNNIANFLNSGSIDLANPNVILPSGLPTSNILGRINGGNPSSIFGMIQTNGPGGFPNANLFLMNPNGFLFGPTATINVGGMVTFTTADYLRHTDNTQFNAVAGPADLLLTAAPVAAFGFLGNNPAAIAIQGSTLQVAQGQSLSLVGGNQGFIATDPDTGNPIPVPGGITMTGGKLSAPGGQINVVSVASPGEVVAGTLAYAPNVNGQSFGGLGSINISQQSFIDASGNNGGTVSIRGGQLVVNDSTIAANTTGPAAGPQAAGMSGAVTLSASTIQLENGATVQANAENGGSAGTITIQGVEGNGSAATNVTMDNATVSTTISGGSAASTPGTISVIADTVTLNNGTFITADTFGAAPAGNITFDVGTLTANGAGGPIRIHVVPESLITSPTFSHTGVLIASDSTSLDAGAGRAGQITIQGVHGPGSIARSVSLDDTILHTRVFGGTADTMPAAITITADSVALSGLSGQVEIYTTTNGAAPAGNVAFNVNTLRANVNPDGSFIPAGKPRRVLIGSPSEKPDSTGGPAGAVIISGPGAESTDPAKLVATSNTEIDTFAVGGSRTSTPAPIIITADTAALNNLTILVTTSNGAAPAGNIVLNVDTLRVNVNPDGTPITNADRVFLNSPGSGLDSTGGPAGTITISGLRPGDPAKLVDLYNAQFSTAVEGGTAALAPGTITITADTMNMSGGTHIFSFTDSAAPAGNIALHVNTLRSNVNPDGTLINGQIFAQITSESIGTNSIPTPEGAVLISDVPGRAGTVTISGISPESTDPARLVALNNTRLSTLVVGGTAATNPATITVTADTVRLTNSPNITTETSGGAPAGHLAFNVNTLTVDQASKISSGTSGTGPGGTVTIAAGQSVTLNHGSSIFASSTGPGIAGDITINAGNQFAMTNSSVTTEANQSSGGAIKITTNPNGTVQLTDSTISASVLNGAGGGGSVNIDPQFVLLQNSQILANAVQGPGGNIFISTNLLLPDANSVISASSQFGQNGTITIQSPIAPASRIVPLSQKPLAATSLLNLHCTKLAEGNFSSFTVAGRDSVPAEPGGWLSSPLALVIPELVGSTATEAETRTSLSESTKEMPILSLRRIAPPGFLTQSFAVDWSTGCAS
jgi:filamentous hemagglutinin family protein